MATKLKFGAVAIKRICPLHLFIDECVEGTLRRTCSHWTGPVNIGSHEMISIDNFVDMIADITGKRIHKRHIPGPTGVRGRNSDNQLIQQKLKWRPSQPLRNGVAKPTSGFWSGFSRRIRLGLEHPPKRGVGVVKSPELIIRLVPT